MDEARARFARAEQLFLAALDHEAPAREAFVATECGADTDLRDLVRQLLSGHERAEPGFLGVTSDRDLSGKRIGEFTLLRLIGAGGMGAVYEAEQDRPRRRVALKLVRALPGLAHDSARLGLEAELMARLSHPGIAQIHAAGTFDDDAGQLVWFAMELVEGAQTLQRFVQSHELPQAARLELFEAVCRAVHHGHQRGVIHCDLKPSNVLVDAGGAPKVIDFGIARATGAQAGAATLRAGSDLAGTLAYMSPEQAGGASERIDTRSDVYSLGVVLYELLLGAPPIEVRGAPLPEALERVRQSNPVRPSARKADFPRDLEVVILKALAKEPDERYGSVNELEDEVRRVRQHEPIVARPPTTLHRLRLYARRNRATATAIVLVAVAVLGASVVSTVAWLRAAESARNESLARKSAERLNQLQASIFKFARPSVALGRDVTVREVLDDAVFAAERELATEPVLLGELLATLGSTYVQIGALDEGARLLERAIELADGAEPATTDRRVEIAQALIGKRRHDEARAALVAALERATGPTRNTALLRLGVVEREANRPEEARRWLETALSELPEDPANSTQRALLLAELGKQAYVARDFALAEARQRAALELLGANLPPDHPSLSGIRSELGSALFELGKIDEASEQWSAALATFERVLEPSHPDFNTVLANLALVHERRREFAKADELLSRAIELRRLSLGPDHTRVADLLTRKSTLLLTSGDLPGAETSVIEAITIRRRALGAESSRDVGLANDLSTLALVQLQRKRRPEALANAREALAIQRVALPAGHADLAKSLTMLGATLLEDGSPSEAEPLLREALEIRRARLPGQWLTANTASVLGACLMALERFSDAEPLLADSLPELEKALGPADFRTKAARERLATLYERTQRGERAAELRAPR